MDLVVFNEIRNISNIRFLSLFFLLSYQIVLPLDFISTKILIKTVLFDSKIIFFTNIQIRTSQSQSH